MQSLETPNITFDPFSKQWMYVLIDGAYGILRSPEGWHEPSSLETHQQSCLEHI